MYWLQINYKYISQKSSDDEAGVAYKVHTPYWQSEGINFLILHVMLYINFCSIKSISQKAGQELIRQEAEKVAFYIMNVMFLLLAR